MKMSQYMSNKNKNKHYKAVALTGVAQRIRRRPANRKVAGLIASHTSGLWARSPQLGVCERQPINVFLIYQCFFLSLSPPTPL